MAMFYAGVDECKRPPAVSLKMNILMGSATVCFKLPTNGKFRPEEDTYSSNNYNRLQLRDCSCLGRLSSANSSKHLYQNTLP